MNVLRGSIARFCLIFRTSDCRPLIAANSAPVFRVGKGLCRPQCGRLSTLALAQAVTTAPSMASVLGAISARSQYDTTLTLGHPRGRRSGLMIDPASLLCKAAIFESGCQKRVIERIRPARAEGSSRISRRWHRRWHRRDRVRASPKDRAAHRNEKISSQ